jgi:hypothetical protein
VQVFSCSSQGLKFIWFIWAEVSVTMETKVKRPMPYCSLSYLGVQFLQQGGGTMSSYPKAKKNCSRLSPNERLSHKTIQFLGAALVGSGLLLGIASAPEAKMVPVSSISAEKRGGSVIVLTPSSSKSGKAFLTQHGSHSSHASHASHFSHYSGR